MARNLHFRDEKRGFTTFSSREHSTSHFCHDFDELPFDFVIFSNEKSTRYLDIQNQGNCVSQLLWFAAPIARVGKPFKLYSPPPLNTKVVLPRESWFLEREGSSEYCLPKKIEVDETLHGSA